MNGILAGAIVTLIAIDLTLHVAQIANGYKPFILFPSWKVYSIWWTSYWGITLVLAITLAVRIA